MRASAPLRMKLDLLLTFRAYRASFMGVSEVAMSHIIAASQKWTHKSSERCRRDQSKNFVRFSFL